MQKKVLFTIIFIFNLLLAEIDCTSPQVGELECVNCKIKFDLKEKIEFSIKNKNSNENKCFTLGIAIKKGERYELITRNISKMDMSFQFLKKGATNIFEWFNRKTELPTPYELKRKGEVIPKDFEFISCDLKRGGTFALVVFVKNFKDFNILHKFELMPQNVTTGVLVH